MTTARVAAPAKVNLTLHVTGQRDNGYHELDSLVVFTDIADRLSATRTADMRLSVSGPFAEGVPTDDSNLVLRAANLLRQIRGVTIGAAITLEKHLPHAAGLGGGSADAAAALNLLAQLWQVAPLPADAEEIVALGADVPVCLSGPHALHMQGIGENVSPAPKLPDCAIVLVNPRVPIPTSAAFAGLADKSNPPMTAMPDHWDFESFIGWLRNQRNDLLPVAEQIAPEVSQALAHLSRMPAVKAVGMSGSGATCYGITRDLADARHVARAIQVSQMGWWVAPALLL